MKKTVIVLLVLLLVGCVPKEEYEDNLTYYEGWRTNNEELFLLSLSQDDLYFFSIDPAYEYPGGKLIKENLKTGEFEVLSSMENGIIYSLINIEEDTYVIESFVNDEGLIVWHLKILGDSSIIDWGVEVEYRTVPKLNLYKDGFVYLKRNSLLDTFQVLMYNPKNEENHTYEIFSKEIRSGTLYTNTKDLYLVSIENTLEKVKYVYNDQGKRLSDVDHLTQFAAIESGLLISEPTSELYRCQNKILAEEQTRYIDDNYCISGLNTVFGDYVLSLREYMVLQQYDGEQLISKNESLPDGIEDTKDYLGVSDGEVTVLIERSNKLIYTLH